MDATVPKLSVRRCKELKGSESETREPDSDRLSQPSVDSQPGLQKLDEEVPVVSSSMAPMILDESKLIDLPTEEGRRRGNELLSLLSEGDKAPCLPDLPPSPELLIRKAEGMYEGVPSTWENKEEWHATGIVASDLRYIPAEQSTTYQWDMTSQSQWDKSQMVHLPPQWHGGNDYLTEEGLNRELVPVLYDASHRAFGPGHTANVLCMPDVAGYEVFLQGAAAQQVEQGRGDELLQTLSRTLWPLLGDPYLYLDIRNQNSVSSGHLILWRSCEGDAADSRRCWSFARHNSCARGDQCRWAHEVPHTMEIYVKVSSARGVSA